MENLYVKGFTRSALIATGTMLLVLSGSVIGAQTVAPTTIRGTIGLLKDQDLIIGTPAGDVRVVLTPKTVIRAETVMKLSEITSGMYLGTTATKQADGNFLASEVHVFSEDQRGTGEGHRPLSSAPESGATMTNANVDRVEDVMIKDIKGRLMTLKYKGGEVKVLVPPEVPLVKRVLGDRSLLKPGAEVSAQASQNADGTLAATQITIRAAQ